MANRHSANLMPYRPFAALLLLSVLVVTGAAETGAAWHWGDALTMEFWRPARVEKEEAPQRCACSSCPVRTTLGREPAQCCCGHGRPSGATPSGIPVAMPGRCSPTGGIPHMMPPSLGYVFLMQNPPRALVEHRLLRLAVSLTGEQETSVTARVAVPPPKAA
ncbi:MAG: hypothetical protein PWP23_1727 [Candidatus Sumerlaeota bacterium]|nr:hypothetical protein [Candidatus Sumerlaeota bacterium]